MSGNWDDSDTDSEPVDIVENPVILPRTRQPSVAKSLEKVAILDNSVAGSVKDDVESDDDSLSVGTVESMEAEEQEGHIVTLDFDSTTNMRKMISLFNHKYRNITAEFADVEIFLISLDSLIVECLAHKYHNWELGGQSLVLCTQIDRFLEQFANIGGKFKLVVFTDFASQFSLDTTAYFARSTAIAHVAAGKFGKDLIYFSSPVDPAWDRFLHDVTPSFLMTSTDNFTKECCAQEDVNLTPIWKLSAFIVIGCPSRSTFFYCGQFCKSECICYNSHWDCNGELLKAARNPTIEGTQFKTIPLIWVEIIKDAKKSSVSEHFDSLACATLLSALICSRRGVSRIYLPDKEGGKRGLDVIRDRRCLLTAAANYLEKVNCSNLPISLTDFWDGRVVLSLFDYICSNEAVLPYRLQEDFAKVHELAGLAKPLAVDTAEKLFEPVVEVDDPLKTLPILYSTKSTVVNKYIPEMANASSDNVVIDGQKQDYASWFKENLSWKLREIPEEVTKKEEVIEDTWQLKRANKARQFMSRWYEMFANSLEGRGSHLLVDFSRVPRIMSKEENDDSKKKPKGWAGQKGAGSGGGKKGKEPVKSKKELILEAKDQKIIESEKTKIKYATQQGKYAVLFLENLYSTLEVPETRALCTYEITIREAKEILANYAGNDNMVIRRTECVTMVGRLKNCFVKHWDYLEEKQKEEIVDIWVSLGFEAPAASKPSTDAKRKKLDLGMNMVYYQLEYAGELVDIQSDPKKDERVTGFSPDAWQRKILDSVDNGHSCIIVAPTSAGKTFVSYYCIEKFLRASDDDVVVYVFPSKALMNQVCGSIYARFKNKSMSRGKALFGTLTPDYGQNQLNCQVLVTVPESLEKLMLSCDGEVQQFVSRIRYVVFDEVHSIGASEEAHIWEHLLLLINCPFLALSATIGNSSKLHEWLASAEAAKTSGKRKVDLIQYGERYSELELSIMNIAKPLAVEDLLDQKDKTLSENDVPDGEVIQPFMPYGLFMPEKLRMFGIPEDQQLTARQILQLYTMMASVDDETKLQFEPCQYFGFKPSQPVWLSRSRLRQMETELKQRFLNWLESDEPKMQKVLKLPSGEVITNQLEHRSQPFDQLDVADKNIISLVDEMRTKNMLPAMCFNDDRHVCERLATTLAETLEEREKEFMNTAEFRNNYAIKDEDKLMKLAKRKRDAAEKMKGDKPEDDVRDQEDASDPLAAQRAKLAKVLERFKLKGRGGGDQDIYDKMVERMKRGAKNRETSRLLLRLFERGIGFHHAGLNMQEKGAVEVLFRAGHLAILFSTSTLALGVNMPCKTVIFGVDTPQLTPLLYRQMSGRAGRRGFDHSGTVIFMSIPTSKMRRLLTASLSNLQGNPPFDVTFILRLFSFVNQKDVMSLEGTGAISTVAQRSQIAMSLLKNSFSLFTRSESGSNILQNQLRMYVAYSIQMLRHLQLLDENCAAKNFAGLVSKLQEYSPGNLLFVHLIHKGSFHQLIKQYIGDKAKMKVKILTVLAILFTRHRMTPSFTSEDKSSYVQDANSRCLVYLPEFPSDMQKQIDQFDETATHLYEKFAAASSPTKLLLDQSFEISGKSSDTSVFRSEELISPVFSGYSHDDSFIPVLPNSTKDHRGRKIYYNAFAVDFYIHESRHMLHSVNKLAHNEMWYQIQDFNECLKIISTGMDVVARPQDAVCEVLRELHTEYESKFRSAFGMRSHNN